MQTHALMKPLGWVPDWMFILTECMLLGAAAFEVGTLESKAPVRGTQVLRVGAAASLISYWAWAMLVCLHRGIS